MIEQELHELIKTVQRRGCEGQTTEVKAAHLGCPKRLYDTISAFSNQDDGGVLLFGLDEQNHFAKVGVYNAQDLQKKGHGILRTNDPDRAARLYRVR